MITAEENRKLEQFISGKNLPLDLKVEILDHISEQINFKMDIESKDFEKAFAEIKNSWNEDLKMKKNLFFGKKRTKIHRDTVRKSDFEISKKTTLYFAAYLAFSLMLLFYNKTLASGFIYFFYILAVMVFSFYLIIDFKIVRSFISKKTSQNISFFQAGSNLFFISSLFIISLILINFDERLDKYYSALKSFISNPQFSIHILGPIFIFNVYAWCWICGFINFLEYKKTLKNLEHKINFKL